MDVKEAILKRRSIRSFSSKDIPEETLREIISLGVRAPSAHNEQPWQFILIRDNEIQRELMLDGEWREQLVKAPAVVAVCFDKKISPYGAVDAGLAAENILLAALNFGISSCVVTSYLQDEEAQKEYRQIKKILNVPENIEVLLLIALGYPAEEPSERRLRPIDELVHLDQYGRSQYLSEEEGFKYA